MWTIICDNFETVRDRMPVLLMRRSRMRAFNWYRYRWPWMTLNGVIAEQMRTWFYRHKNSGRSTNANDALNLFIRDEKSTSDGERLFETSITRLSKNAATVVHTICFLVVYCIIVLPNTPRGKVEGYSTIILSNSLRPCLSECWEVGYSDWEERTADRRCDHAKMYSTEDAICTATYTASSQMLWA